MSGRAASRRPRRERGPRRRRVDRAAADPGRGARGAADALPGRRSRGRRPQHRAGGRATSPAGRVRLRPHFKAHKCSRLLARQLAAGGCVGVTCATAWEAEVLARAGFDDILVANQVADAAGLGAARAPRPGSARVTVVRRRRPPRRPAAARRAGGRRAARRPRRDRRRDGRSGLDGGSEALLPLVGSVVAAAGAPVPRPPGLRGTRGARAGARGARGVSSRRAAEILRAEQERARGRRVPVRARLGRWNRNLRSRRRGGCADRDPGGLVRADGRALRVARPAVRDRALLLRDRDQQAGRARGAERRA